MIHNQFFSKMLNVMTSEPFTNELKKARTEYTKVAGEVFEDDKSFEMRMNSFLEWYILDRPISSKNKTPLLLYLDEYNNSFSDEESEFLHGIKNNIHSIFEVKGQKKEFIRIKDLLMMERYNVSEDNSHFSFRKGDIVEARLLPFREKYFFSNAFCFHPQKIGKFIKSELKKIHLQKGGGGQSENKIIKDFIQRLSYMNLKWERARQIDANDIYR